MRTLILLLAMAVSVEAQNVAVRWTGANTNGTPVYWPIIVRQVGTNTVLTGCVVLTHAQLDNVIQTNMTAFQAAQEAATTITKEKAQAFITALEASMQQATDSVALIDGGTLTTAQRNAEFGRLKTYLADIRARVNKILTISDRLFDSEIFSQ